MNDGRDIPQPVVETDQDHLPIALTFFLSRGQRIAIVRALRSLDTDRTRALMLALSIPVPFNESQDGSLSGS